jgi:hypothetical protein
MPSFPRAAYPLGHKWECVAGRAASRIYTVVALNSRRSAWERETINLNSNPFYPTWADPVS